jgi:hypothetical protein
MPRPVCVKCHKEFRVEKNGVIAQENTGPDGNPYKIWSADLWECPGCHIQILSGYGLKPLKQYHDEDFEDYQKSVEIFFY